MQDAWAGGSLATEGVEGIMDSFSAKLSRLVKSEDGPTAVEYAIMLALIVVACLSAIGTIGTNANTKFWVIASSLQ